VPLNSASERRLDPDIVVQMTLTQLLTSALLIQIVDAYRASPLGHGHPATSLVLPFSTLLYLPSKQRIQGLREEYKGKYLLIDVRRYRM
jgi:hypothetical protein